LPVNEEKFAEEPEVRVERVRYISKTGRFKWLTLPSVLFIVAIILYLLLFRNRPSNPEIIDLQKQKTGTESASGANRATLTLGNGAEMILDSQSLGVLAQQGNTRISKTDSGRLTYTVESAKFNPVTVEYNTLTTPRDGQYELVLPDGSRVWLNAASSVTYPVVFTGTQRFVRMTGELYFEVLHNSSMPFTIKAGNRVITDLTGGSFDINTYPGKGAIVVTSLKGNVKIFVGAKTNLLGPGQQEISSLEGHSVTIRNRVDTLAVVSWIRNR
jgi:transmembrane sensor